MKIYIACGLTHVPRHLFAEYSGFIHDLAKALAAASPSNEVRYALANSDPQLAQVAFSERARRCYLWDRQMVEDADLVIGEASFPSTGLGIELQIAEMRHTPVVLCFHDFGTNHVAPVTYETPDHRQHQLQIGAGFISLMALGMPCVIQVVRYGDAADGIARILAATALVEPLQRLALRPEGDF